MKRKARKGAGRPKGSTLPPGKKRVKTSVTLRPDDLAWIDQAAAHTGLKRTTVIDRAIDLYRETVIRKTK